MKLVELVKLCRDKTRDYPGSNAVDWTLNDTDLAISNAEWVSYLEQARDQYCYRRPVCDANSGITQVTLTGGGTGRVGLSPSILCVDRVMAVGADKPLEKVDKVHVDSHLPLWWQQVGNPSHYLDHEQENELHAFPVPVADLVLSLTVRRLPLVPLSWVTKDSEVADVSASDQAVLADYACGLAYLKDDELIHDIHRSTLHFNRFDHQMGPRPDAQARQFGGWLVNLGPRARAYY